MKKNIIPEKLNKALLQLNLTEKEIATFVVLLQNGPSSVQDIHRASGINRVSIYAAIEELKAKKLLVESRKGRKKLFVAENPESLKNLLEDKRTDLLKDEELLKDLVLPMLSALYVSEKSKPQIRFFEGAEGINKIYDAYMLKSRDMINCGSYQTSITALTEKVEIDYFKTIEKNKIFYRAILQDTELDRKFAEIGKGIMHTKFFPRDVEVPGDIIVSGNYTALISYDKKTSVLIEDETIAKTIRVYLEFMWERL